MVIAFLIVWNVNYNQSGLLAAIGNSTRDLWKLTAWNLSETVSMPAKERAIYSALCGNATQLINSRVCKSWEDVVWAR